jgi:uncharacterized cupredoxin-like copper-binding protein
MSTPDAHSVEFTVDRDIRTKIRRCLAIGMFVVLGPAACSTAPQPKGQIVDVTLGDFHIDNATPSVASGDVVMQVHNDAPATHEFVVVRTDLPAGGLPLGPDGLSVNEDWLDGVGEINDVAAGTVGTLPLTLAPGRYVFFCNLDGHYLGGMHAVLEVAAHA